ncbi:MAG: tRNA (adenosine(37)-N6)-threonylcarbamoyltransferase complex transferase subunit TsaD [Patescibacteria group bacterium]
MNNKKEFIILGIETSCDETAASILEIRNKKLEIRSNVVASQVDIHRQYGGIVPEVAARAHIEKIIPIINESIVKSGIKNPESSIQLVAVTNGPGLITSLLVGVETAKVLAYVWQKPLLPINHLIGHIYAAFINNQLSMINNQSFPAICLVVSGGHTELILMRNHYQFQKIGQTLDDAVGECFDKVAKLLEIGYPGGPAIAAQAQLSMINNQLSLIKLPRPMIKTKDYNFSFSGLKTAVLYTLKNFKSELAGSKKEISQKLKKLPQKVRSKRKQFISAICAEVQQAVIDVLISKTIRAARDTGAKTVILCGGVAANSELRRKLELKTKNLKLNFLVPPKNLCTDNAAMIAIASYFQWLKLNSTQRKKLKDEWREIEVNPNLEIS